MEQIELILKMVGGTIAVFSFIYGFIKIRQDLQNKFFQDYTKRYYDIMSKLPFEVHTQEYDFNSLDKDKTEVLKYIMLYFDLCSEEYHLFLERKISKKVWNEWKSGIENNFRKKAFINAWQVLIAKNYTQYYPNFTKLVETELIKK